MKQHVVFWIWDPEALTSYLHSHEDPLEFWRCCCRRSTPERAVIANSWEEGAGGWKCNAVRVDRRRTQGGNEVEPLAQITSSGAALQCH